MTMQTKSFAGMFSPVAGPDGTRIDPTSITRKGGKQRKKLVDTSDLPDEYKEAVEAEHFIIFGKASVEQYDDDTPSQKIEMEALQDALPQLFKSGLISRRHKDVRVGEVKKTHTLEEDRTVQVGDETKEFKEGDVLSTHVEDDEVWLVADIWNDTEIAKDTRLRSLTGDLNGFSVTIYAKETQPTAKGELVTDVDWHAVTIGSDDKIKNKDSRFGVAEFKAMFGDPDDPVTGKSAAGEALRTTATTMWRNLLSKSADETGFNGELLEAASEAAEKAQTDDVDLKEAADEVVDETDLKADDVVEAVNILGDNATGFKAGDDLEEVLQAVAQGDLSPEEAMQMMAEEDDDEDEGEMKEGGEDEDDEMDEEDKGDYEDDEEEEDEKSETDEDEKSFEEKLDEHGVVTEDKLDEKLGEVQSDVEETINKAFEDSVPDADEIAEKMETGSTSDPASGSGKDQKDYTEEITSAFGGGD